MDLEKLRALVLARKVRAQSYPPLEQVERPTVSTAQAAYYLNRKPHTLRFWASNPESAPLEPIRVQKRLAWRVKDIKRLLEVE